MERGNDIDNGALVDMDNGPSVVEVIVAMGCVAVKRVLSVFGFDWLFCDKILSNEADVRWVDDNGG